ncbi:hypothetical protein [Variovorax sp. GB1P17]|uniref:hypothetical protein n=1 Tax=Variovorax sp. GB1P17 TaxID=3443740 RepID=UPI003F47DE7F
MTQAKCSKAAMEQDAVQAALERQVAFFHEAFTEWLADPAITIACGRWADGAISEIVPMGRASLLPAIYGGCFTGVRELRLAQAPHHLHVDFGRVHSLCYTVAPSVCLDFNPSLEVRLLVLGAGGMPSDRWVVSLMFSNPYRRDGTIDQDAACRFFRSAQRHLAVRPDLVTVEVAAEVRGSVHAGALFECLATVTGAQQDGLDWTKGLAALGVTMLGAPALEPSEPIIVPLLRDALALRDASLVIFRDRTLVEFKTERLGGLHRYVEQGHVSWQIGAFDDHHCHLALSAVTRVHFSAEPVPCQGNRLNYTIWFLVPGACGNPYRRDGYFSITLNKPYEAGIPRRDVIEPVLALYRRYATESWVQADAQFLDALHAGPTAKKFGSQEHAAAE